MATNKTDFLKFSAYSIKELITRKLAENSKFTDEIYEGSNLATLIDIVSYMYQCLILQINNAASESMWSDTQIYENINRLCKFIGYSPHGVKPAMANFEYVNENIGDDANRGKTIPSFYYIDTGKTDRNGKKIYFSTYEDTEINDNINTNVALYNGIWKAYPTTFTASGLENETILLNYLDANTVAGEFIYVYITSSDGETEPWRYDKDELFINMSRENVTEINFASIYNNKEPVYSVRVNEDKNYEIKFGNNVIGKKLSNGDLIHILYLETNGEDGHIDMSDIQTAELIDGTLQFPSQIKKLLTDESSKIATNVKLHLIENSTKPTPIETVDEIRQNAPYYFKYGNRLITKEDYEYFIRTNYINEVVDVKCQNNFDYISTFFKWLWNIGKNGKLTTHEKRGDYYIKQDRLFRNNYTYADPSDSNNVYIWLKFISRIQNSSIYIKKVQQSINRLTKNLKTLTQEITACDAIDVKFAICAAPETIALNDYLLKEDMILEENNDSYIEITMDDNILYANSNIKSQIVDILWNSFKAENCKLGQNVDINNMTNQILSLNGIIGIRTIFKKGDIEIKKNGLSFASWSAKYIETGDDIEVSNSSRTLEEFQFPTLLYTDKSQLLDKVVVIKKSLSNINTIKY